MQRLYEYQNIQQRKASKYKGIVKEKSKVNLSELNEVNKNEG